MCVDQPNTGLPHAHAFCMTQYVVRIVYMPPVRHTVPTRITKCTKFGQLILTKIIKIFATRCQILRLKCTKFDFGWGSAPDPAGRVYSAPPDPLAGFKGPTSKEREGRGRKGGEGGEGRDEEIGKGREGERGREERERGGQGWEGKFRGQGEGKGRERGREKERGGKI